MIHVPRDPNGRLRASALSLKEIEVEAKEILHLVHDAFVQMSQHPPLIAMLALHGIAIDYFVAAKEPAFVVLHLAVTRGLALNLLSHSDIVNWLARYQPTQLRILQEVMELTLLRGAAAYPTKP